MIQSRTVLAFGMRVCSDSVFLEMACLAVLLDPPENPLLQLEKANLPSRDQEQSSGGAALPQSHRITQCPLERTS